ncbi:MAG: low molecular weight phosphotyrosine protein phosphatase [Clostridia bacterium]|nr:low molecular weight phosphotyrosine protein phosphatase [Clostridia bacterium]
MTKIMFVCHGNICRSPMAEFVMKKLVSDRGLSSEFEIASSATSTEEIGNDIHPGTRRTLDKYSVPYSRRGAVQLVKSDYENYDLFVGMDSANIRNMHRIFGADRENKVVKLLDYTGNSRDVADPWYTGNFEETWQDISQGCEALLKKYIE